VRNVTFTGFRNVHDTTGKVINQSWEQWLELFSVHDVRGKPEDTSNKAALDSAKDGEAIVLGVIPSGKSRKKSNVTEVHALGLDLEDEPEDKIESVFEKLSRFEFVVWTTHKHGSEVANGCPRLRVILPFDKPIKAEQHTEAWFRLNQLIDGLNDSKTKDVGRLLFLPSTFDKEKAWYYHHSGKWLSLSDLPELDKSQGSSYSSISSKTAISKIRRQIARVEKSDPLKEKLVKLSNGEVFAESGDRHNSILELTMWVAAKNNELDDSAIRDLFEPSIVRMQQESDDSPDIEEVITAYKGAVEKRNVSEQEYREQQRKQAQEEQLKASSSGPYTEEDIKRIASKNGWEVDDLRYRWIIQKSTVIWILNEHGNYSGPFTKDEWPASTARMLARAPIHLTEVGRSGIKWRSLPDIFRDYSTIAHDVIADLVSTRSWFDAKTNIMREAVSPVRDIEPKFDSEIDEWLKLLCGKYYDKIVNWLACASDLTKMLCAVYFEGDTLSGKTLFAHGVAKIWTEGPPAEMGAVLSNFNDEVVRCPLILADEEIQQNQRNTVSAAIRSMLSTTSRTLKRKYLPNAQVDGCIRLVLTANNEFLLDSKDVSSHQDLEALAQRFLHVKVGEKTAKYLEGLSRVKKEYWKEQGIAAHALWLAKNHNIIDPGKRFWVEGDSSHMHSMLLTGSKWNSLVCEWLVKYLMNPKPFDTKRCGLIRRGNGALLVNDQAIMDSWDLYLHTKQEAETSKIGAALRALSKDSKRIQLRFQGSRIRYRNIAIEHLFSWIERYNIGNRETVEESLNVQLEDEENE
jgi:hypothetical protein